MSPNPISEALSRSGSKPFLDLMNSNPTQCEFDYPQTLLEPLGLPHSLVYEPLSFGSEAAREALAGYLASKGQKVKAQNLLLTASTSEAYSYLFKLLGNPGDSFLIPSPGYPLLEHLLRLEGLKAIPYPLKVAANWPLELEKVERAITSRCKGLIVVNPNNPTGCFLSPNDQSAIIKLCEKHGLAYISDEVFSDFAYPPFSLSDCTNSQGLSFRLGGLSKSLGLPQLKLSWVAMEGPEEVLKESRERLELIADTYLSVNTPVQIALKELLQFAPDFQKEVLSRVSSNRLILERNLKEVKEVKVWPAQGGWYALVEITKQEVLEEALIIELLEKHQVFVQPGAFYDFPSGCFLVLSLLGPANLFVEGVSRLKKALSGL